MSSSRRAVLELEVRVVVAGFCKQLGRDTIRTQTFANDNAGLGREKFEKYL